MIRLPDGVNIHNLIDDLRVLSWEACEILLFYSQKIKDSKNKSEIIKSQSVQDPVTVADLEVNDLIINRIKQKYKDICWTILSEENAKNNFDSFNKNFDWIWVLDPLDGTKDFIQGTGNYAMHLALNYKNKPFIGFVLIPERDELWISNGEKSWCERKNGSLKNSKMSRKNHINDMKIVTSKNHRNNSLNKLIEKLNFKDVIVMGSIGCKVASILRGESDIYISLSIPGKSAPKDWDFAAPEAILKTAGGEISTLKNEELSYCKLKFEQRGVIVASNDYLNHKDICMKVTETIKKYDLNDF